MKFSRLVLYIALAVFIFWVLGLLLKLTAWLFEVGLVVALLLVVIALVSSFLEDRKLNK